MKREIIKDGILINGKTHRSLEIALANAFDALQHAPTTQYRLFSEHEFPSPTGPIVIRRYKTPSARFKARVEVGTDDLVRMMQQADIGHTAARTATLALATTATLVLPDNVTIHAPHHATAASGTAAHTVQIKKKTQHPVTITHHQVVSAKPTQKDINKIIHSVDRMMANEKLMKLIMYTAGINHTNVPEMMLTITFETGGDETKFQPTIYTLHGKKIKHSATGPFQLMPNQFIGLARQNGEACAKNMYVYAASLSDQQEADYIRSKARELEVLSKFLQQHPHKNYKALVGQNKHTKDFINKSYHADYFIGMVLQDASNKHDVNAVLHHLHKRFGIGVAKLSHTIGEHIQMHLVNFLGPHMSEKIVSLIIAGKGDLSVVHNLMPKYMAEQNNSYCNQYKIVSVAKKVRIPVPAKKAQVTPHSHVQPMKHGSLAKQLPHLQNQNHVQVNKTIARPPVVAKNHAHTHAAPVHPTISIPRATTHPHISTGHNVKQPTAHDAQHHGIAHTQRKTTAHKQQYQIVIKYHNETQCAVLKTVQDDFNDKMVKWENLSQYVKLEMDARLARNPQLAASLTSHINNNYIATAKQHAATPMAQTSSAHTPPTQNTILSELAASLNPLWQNIAREFGAITPPAQKQKSSPAQTSWLESVKETLGSNNPQKPTDKAANDINSSKAAVNNG